MGQELGSPNFIHKETLMESKEHHLQAFDLLRQAAHEYNNAEFKFYTHGFFKFVREGKGTFLIEDIYIHPDFRGTPVAQDILSQFETYMKSQNVIVYYGRVFKQSLRYVKRISTFKKWGMKESYSNDSYTTVTKMLEY